MAPDASEFVFGQDGNPWMLGETPTSPWPYFGNDKHATQVTNSPVPSSQPSQSAEYDAGRASNGGFYYQVTVTPDRIAYFDYANDSGSDELIQFDRSTGDVVAATDILQESSSEWADVYQMTPLQDGSILAFADGFGQGVAGAVDSDGNMLWYFNSGDFADYAGKSFGGAWNGNLLVAGGNENFEWPRLVELNGETGAQENILALQNPDDEGPVFNTPVIVNESESQCYVHAAGHDTSFIEVVDLSSFTLSHSRHETNVSYGNTWFFADNGIIYTSHDGGTLAYDPVNDTDQWTLSDSDFSNISQIVHWVYYQPDDNLFGVSQGGNAASVDAAAGTVNYEVSTAFDAGSSGDMFGILDAESGVAVYGPDSNSTIFAFDVTDGSVLWTFSNTATQNSLGRVAHDSSDGTLTVPTGDIGNGNTGIVKLS